MSADIVVAAPVAAAGGIRSGFLREANATLFMGVEDDEVETVVHTIRENCTTRQQQITAIPAVMEPGEFFLPYPVEVEVGGATIFVLDVARFERV